MMKKGHYIGEKKSRSISRQHVQAMSNKVTHRRSSLDLKDESTGLPKMKLDGSFQGPYVD